MKTFDQWLADNTVDDDGPVFMECYCGLRETVKRAALLNGDTRWFTDTEGIRVGDHVRGLCCSQFCMP